MGKFSISMISFVCTFSDDRESSAFYKNVFNGASCLTGQTLWLRFLFQYERLSKPCMTNAQSGYNDLFSSWFLSKLVSTLPRLAEFGRVYSRCYCSIVFAILYEGIYCLYQVSIWNPGFIGGGIRSKADLATEFVISLPLTPTWLGVQHIIFFLFDIESNLLNMLMIGWFWIF